MGRSPRYGATGDLRLKSRSTWVPDDSSREMGGRGFADHDPRAGRLVRRVRGRGSAAEGRDARRRHPPAPEPRRRPGFHRNGSPGSPTPTPPATCRSNSSDSAATRCSSSTRSGTSRSRPRPRTCSSSSSPLATSAAPLIVTSNKPFGRWGEVFGDDIVAAAMIDRLVHHAEVVALKGDSYRLKTATSAASQPPHQTNNDPKLVNFQLPSTGQFWVAVDTCLTSEDLPGRSRSGHSRDRHDADNTTASVSSPLGLSVVSAQMLTRTTMS